jgi:hypothetical protein
MGVAWRDKYQCNLKLLVLFFKEPSLTFLSIGVVITFLSLYKNTYVAIVQLHPNSDSPEFFINKFT